LFLHGQKDSVVPIATMLDYHQALLAAGVESEAVVDEAAGHAWLDAAPERVLDWFERRL
jgi:poly(3-hydroxyoctanoate) depolymerase